MFKNNKIIKFLTATAFTVVGIFSTQNMVNNTVKADYIHNVGSFHYLNKKHTYKTLGYSEGFPYISRLDNGKYYTDDSDDTTSQADGIAKTNGYRYINGEKYYRIPLKHSNISVEYVRAKYFTKKYNDLSYEQIYTVTKAFSPRNGDMQASKTNLMLHPGAAIEVDMYSKDNDIVSIGAPLDDNKHGLTGFIDDGSFHASAWLKITQSQFRNNCRKAAPNTKFVFNDNGDYETNASLARGGIYHKGHFYKVYTR